MVKIKEAIKEIVNKQTELIKLTNNKHIQKKKDHSLLIIIIIANVILFSIV